MRRKAKRAANLEAKRRAYVISMMSDRACPHRLVVLDRSEVTFFIDGNEIVYRCMNQCGSVIMLPMGFFP